jgi:hypothetical protein
MAMTRAFEAIDAERASTGETFAAAFGRMLIAGPITRWERRGMIRPLRRDGGDDSKHRR